jgi:uncharacterized iron-regulated protein
MIKRTLWLILVSAAAGCTFVPPPAPDTTGSDAVRIIDVKSGKPVAWRDMLRAIGSDRVVYLGEQHDNVHQHDFQRDVIEAMYAQDPKLAIGMEMFQRPYQEPLTEFVEGKIDEEEFLRRTEYFTRWGWDYHWYRPILLFAREHRLPVIALNAPREVNRKVSRGGLDSLTEEERAWIAAEIDLGIEAHREYVKRVWDQHPMPPGMMTFDNFYASQCVWEDTMAESVANALAERPGYRMAVVVGGGHVQRGFGVPIRAERRGAAPMAILVGAVATGPLTDEDIAQLIEGDPGDYVFVTGPAEAPPTRKLGVMLSRTDNGEGVLVTSVVPGGIAGLAGVEPQDRIMLMNGKPVEDSADLKLRLTMDDNRMGTIEVLRGTQTKKLNYDLMWGAR